MEAAPFICLACGELIIVVPNADRTMTVPVHPDRVMPFSDCTASSQTIITQCDNAMGWAPDPGSR